MMILRRDFLKALIAAPVALSIPLPSHLFATGGIVPKTLYGNVRTPGLLVGIASTGPRNELLHQIIALAPHPIESVNAVFLNDIESEDECFAGHVTIKSYLGHRTQSVIPSSGLFHPSFLSRTSLSYLYVILKWNPVIFVTGIPKITAEVCGTIVSTSDEWNEPI